jgi:hypothetical protein
MTLNEVFPLDSDVEYGRVERSDCIEVQSTDSRSVHSTDEREERAHERGSDRTGRNYVSTASGRTDLDTTSNCIGGLIADMNGTHTSTLRDRNGASGSE